MGSTATVTPLVRPARVVLVEARAMLRNALTHALHQGRLTSVTTVANLEEEGASAACATADVVLLGTDARVGGTTRVVRRVVEGGTPVLLHGECADILAISARLRAGASGFVGYDQPVVRWIEAVRAVRSGAEWLAPCVVSELRVAGERGPHLSRQEEEVFTGYAAGASLQQVARRLGLPEGTARANLERARAKYQAAGRRTRTRVELYRRAVEDGLLPIPQAGHLDD